jgi:hypothetical protein
MLHTILTETRQHVTHFNNTYRDTIARDTLHTILTEARQHVTHFIQYLETHDST